MNYEGELVIYNSQKNPTTGQVTETYDTLTYTMYAITKADSMYFKGKDTLLTPNKSFEKLENNPFNGFYRFSQGQTNIIYEFRGSDSLYYDYSITDITGNTFTRKISFIGARY